MICLNYWCDTPDKKQRFINILKKNEKEYQEQLQIKYNPDDLFKDKKEIQEEYLPKEENSLMVCEKEKWYKKLFNKIKKYFKI